MATTLSFGWIKPDAGDSASVWQDALEGNVVLTNDHTHDGIDSSTISPASITKFTTAILSAAWVEEPASSGNYEQTVSTPAQISEINDFWIKFYNTANGDPLYLSWERVTGASFKVFINDNSLDLTAVYI